jgi:hypothetical protein
LEVEDGKAEETGMIAGGVLEEIEEHREMGLRLDVHVVGQNLVSFPVDLVHR